MKSIIKKGGAIILTFAMLLTGISGFPDVKVAKAEEVTTGQTVTADNGVKFVEYTDIENYRQKKTEIKEKNGTVVKDLYAQSPKLPGYVFAGWFKNANTTSYIPTETRDGSAWAKFVPQETFTIKAQIRNSAGASIDTSKETALDSVSKVDIRFITGIDSLKYRRVIFSATHLGVEVNNGMNKVMTSLDIQSGESSITASEAFGATAKYFATLRYTGIAKSTAQAQRFLKDWKIIPKLITQDGTLVEGITRDEFKIQDAVSKKFQVTDGSSTIIYNTTQAKVVANMTNTNVSQLFLKGADGTRYSKRWEISGAFKNITGNATKGFIIQADDAAEIANKTTKYYTMNKGGVAMDAAGTTLGKNILSLTGIECKNVWLTTRYVNGISTVGDYVRFKAVIANDVFSLWIDDELVWQLPLTDATFGGYEAGSSYRIALCGQGNGTKVNWTDLKVKYGDDVKPYKFFLSDRRNYNAMDEGVTLDNTFGKVTVNLDERYSKRVWLKSADGVDSSTNWEITGTMKVLVPLVKGFTIRDESGNMGNYSLWWGGVAVNEYESDGDWDIVRDTKYVTATSTYNTMDSDYHGSYKFKLVIQNDYLEFWLENKQEQWEKIWNLPLTSEQFGWRTTDSKGHVTGKGAFTKGSSYRVALRGLDEGGQMEWSDLEVYAKQCSGTRIGKYYTANEGWYTMDTTAGKITVDNTSTGAMQQLYLKDADGTYCSTSWEITGTYKQLVHVMEGFNLLSKDRSMVGYYTPYSNGVSLQQRWGYPETGEWNHIPVDGKNILASAGTFGESAGGERFKLLIQNDIFSFWVGETLIWQLPLTDAKFGYYQNGTRKGFPAGTSYLFAIRHIDAGKAEWSDLTVKCGKDKFSVAQIESPATMNVDTINGNITVDMGNIGTNKLWFATDDASYSSTKWEITGNYKQLTGHVVGFTIQSANGAQNGYYTFWPGSGIALTEGWGYIFVNPEHPEGSTDYHMNVYYPDGVNIFTNARYNAMSGINDNARFRMVLKEDVLSLWVDDVLTWRLPLTNALFGGFAAGTSYRFSIRHRDVYGQAEWSDLTVKYGNQVH